MAQLGDVLGLARTSLSRGSIGWAKGSSSCENFRVHAAIAGSSVIKVEATTSACVDSYHCCVDSQVRVLEVTGKTVAVVGRLSGSSISDVDTSAAFGKDFRGSTSFWYSNDFSFGGAARALRDGAISAIAST